MALNFHVSVVSADKLLYQGDAISLVAPGIDGYFGILYGHAPLIGALKIGELEITTAENPSAPLIFAVAAGFIEVTADKVTILADSAELATQIDIERALLAKERAENLLRSAEGITDVERAQIALARALNRLRTAEKTHGI